MLPVDCRGGHVFVINTCIDTSLSNFTVNDGVNDRWFKRNEIDVAG